MKKCFSLLMCIGLLSAFTASAQTASVPVSATLTWTLPTKSVGQPIVDLTGAYAITETQIFVSTMPIADNSIAAPTARTAANATTYTYTGTAAVGSTLYFRLKTCNSGGCSAFSSQASAVVSVPVPASPTGFSVVLTIVTGH